MDQSNALEKSCDEAGNTAVAFKDALKVWVKVSLNSFGGPAAQIAVMHKYLVQEKKWISDAGFLHALNYCMLLPGPEAQQLATYIGKILNGTIGGVVAGGLFVIPGFFVMLGLSIMYVEFREITIIDWIFFGIKAAILAIIAEALIKIGKRALRSRLLYFMAGLSFLLIFFYDVPFPLIVLGAGIVGYGMSRLVPQLSLPTASAASPCNNLMDISVQEKPTFAGSLRTAMIWLAVWFFPVVLVYVFFGSNSVFFREALFFSKTAVVTFGGAYAVLAYVAQQAVDHYGWLLPGEMVDGLGLAETTPGPLILVLQFVGFLGAYRSPGDMNPIMAGILGSFITSWVTFTPSFLWIFLGAPYIERLRSNTGLNAALSGITAAVVGVVLNLSVWFALHVLFGKIDDVHLVGAHIPMPVWQTINTEALIIFAVAVTLLFILKRGMALTLGVCAGLGVLVHVIGK